MDNLIKKVIQDIAIFLLMLIGVRNMVAVLPLKLTNHLNYYISRLIDPNALVLHHVLSFFLGALMLFLAYRLYKRIRTAWLIEVLGLSVTLLLHLTRYQRVSLHFVLIVLFVWIVLLLSYKDFCRRADSLTIRKALFFIAASVFIVLTNATVGLIIMKGQIHNIHNIYDAILSSIQLLVLMDTNVLSITSKVGKIYANSLIAINWICIISSLILLLKPLVYNPIASKHDKDKVRHFVLRFGQNPISYLALENDKKYFFGKSVDGVCPYQLVGYVFVVCGDMICDEKDGFIFLNEVLAFCKQNGYYLIFLNITNTFTQLYKMAGFGILKFGEDACFKLNDYNLAGGKVAKVRAAINHANKAGISVIEYKPLESRDYAIEHQISDISKEWLESKGGYEIGFMLGGTSLDDPLDRRYFYAVDADGKILGFVVFLPYYSGKGYLADVTRRRNDAPQGVLEKIIYEAFMKMKKEGVDLGNMGLSPLYNVAEGDKAAIPEKLFNYIYENMNNTYNFKALHHAKEKYAPTEWQPRYMAYYPRLFSPNFAYAIGRVQVGKGLTKLVISGIGRKKDRCRGKNI